MPCAGSVLTEHTNNQQSAFVLSSVRPLSLADHPERPDEATVAAIKPDIMFGERT